MAGVGGRSAETAELIGELRTRLVDLERQRAAAHSLDAARESERARERDWERQREVVREKEREQERAREQERWAEREAQRAVADTGVKRLSEGQHELLGEQVASDYGSAVPIPTRRESRAFGRIRD